ncbi:hypothetical protein BT96DRAFT_991722 [Gymnopus androsaceus JB14]|uniref:Uncharacterized protein n=1 Tax=Gymnopus androsaceus JB14 TaxID=1447944 RepID=A0A6A4HUL9_9AGAR|nr:hypothetical protein BT96DRAFT_991722 [Gymnopus androsaceus JB14]
MILAARAAPQDLPDGGYLTPKGFVVYGNDAASTRDNVQAGLPIPRGGFDILLLRRRTDITTPLAYIMLVCMLQNLDDAGDNPGPLHWRAFTLTRDLYKEARGLAENRQNDLHCTALSNFFRPRSVSYTYKRKREEERARFEPGPSSDMMGSLPITHVVRGRTDRGGLTKGALSRTRATRLRPTGQPRMKNPTKNAPPEE